MRSLLLLLVLAASASADVAVLPPLDVGTIPTQCRGSASEPASARDIGPRLAAYTSAASCMAIVRLHALRLSPTHKSVEAVDAALAPSVALLDAVIQNGDDKARIEAQYAKADLYSGAGVALLASIPEPRRLSGPAVAERDAMVRDAVALVQPWREKARDSYREVARLGAGSELLADPVIAFEVRVSRQSQITGIATR